MDYKEIRIRHRIKPSLNLLYIDRLEVLIKPKDKFIRKREKVVILRQDIVAEFQIDVPFKMVTQMKTRTWLGDGIQHDDIFCSEDYEETKKVYDPEKLELFIQAKLKQYESHRYETI